MTDIDLEGLSEIEELRCILSLHDQASQYLESFEWYVKTIRSWHDKEHSIYEKVGVFLFEIQPINESIDDFIWVIVGDLPSVYLDKSVKTGQEALEIYCDLMMDWVNNVKGRKSVSECYPVPVEPNTANAELLEHRISFIRRELLTTQ
ncbi:MAG: hypothetical protein H7Y13_09000 [Sphingobacteriaceae bacterium]|nr:hypothetical protein [Sphingobacteriaceae bacterium]